MSLADPAQQQQPTGLAGFLTGQPIEQQVASFFSFSPQINQSIGLAGFLTG
jgi:hypothetical protein